MTEETAVATNMTEITPARRVKVMYIIVVILSYLCRVLFVETFVPSFAPGRCFRGNSRLLLLLRRSSELDVI